MSPVDVAAIEARMKADKRPPVKLESLWVLDDGRKGNLNRCLGLAAALGFDDPEVISLHPRWQTRWLDWLPVTWVFNDLPKQPYPQVVIGAGARCSRVLAWMKQQAPALSTVQIMRPAKGYKAYDVVVMEAHDAPPKRANVCVTTGAVNHVTRDKLDKEAQRWERRLGSCKAPRLAVMVGGDSRHGAFGVEDAKRLAGELLAGAQEAGMSLLVTTSRRTGPDVAQALEKALTQQTRVPVHIWHPDNPLARDNPYMAYLGLAQAVVVTGDSISMVSEAATAGKPVYVWTGGGKLPRKFKTFLESLMAQGRVRLWGGKLNLRPPAAPLMDTMVAAGFVKAKLRQRG